MDLTTQISENLNKYQNTLPFFLMKLLKFSVLVLLKNDICQWKMIKITFVTCHDSGLYNFRLLEDPRRSLGPFNSSRTISLTTISCDKTYYYNLLF